MLQNPSPNFSTDRKGYKPELIVIHIMAGTLSGTDAWFANPTSKVSAHYGIGKGGEVHQYVEQKNVAWHAGNVAMPIFKLYKKDVNPNLYTIGIEHEGQEADVWTDAMKKSSATLIKEISNRWGIPIDRDHIIGHYQIFAGKPNCPAKNKGIIDELIELAGPRQTIKDGVTKIEEGLGIIKKFI